MQMDVELGLDLDLDASPNHQQMKHVLLSLKFFKSH